ncbi:MAG: glycosyltransferase family 1 protein [Deltaproteobacteria bacterium]
MDACRIKYRLPKRFILWIGNSKKHKNLERTVLAFERLKTDVKLVLVGVNYQTTHPQIHSVGHVDAQDLVCLYQLSAFFVYPSLYEGFGLPVMEALACGKKIVVSDRSPLSEIAGTAAILVDPLDIDAIANAMQRLLSDPQTYQADQEGIRHSQKFSWEEAARKTLEVYENCNRS